MTHRVNIRGLDPYKNRQTVINKLRDPPYLKLGYFRNKNPVYVDYVPSQKADDVTSQKGNLLVKRNYLIVEEGTYLVCWISDKADRLLVTLPEIDDLLKLYTVDNFKMNDDGTKDLGPVTRFRVVDVYSINYNVIRLAVIKT